MTDILIDRNCDWLQILLLMIHISYNIQQLQHPYHILSHISITNQTNNNKSQQEHHHHQDSSTRNNT